MGPEVFQSKIVSLVGPRQVQCHSAQVRSKTAYTRSSGAQNFTHAHHRSRRHSVHVRSMTVYTRPSGDPDFTRAHLGSRSHSVHVRSKTVYTRPSGAQNFTCPHLRSRCHSTHVRSKTVYTRPSEAQKFTHAHLGPKFYTRPWMSADFRNFKIFLHRICVKRFFSAKMGLFSQWYQNDLEGTRSHFG